MPTKAMNWASHSLRTDGSAHSKQFVGVNANVAMFPVLQTLAEIDDDVRHGSNACATTIFF